MSKWNKDTRRKICDKLRTGRKRHHAAALAGIGERTLGDWIRRGNANLEQIERWENGDWPDGEPRPRLDEYGRFAQSVRLAEAHAEEQFARTYLLHCKNDPIWADKWLRRHRPDVYNDRLELTGPGGGPIKLDMGDPVAELESRVALALERAGKTPDPPKSEP